MTVKVKSWGIPYLNESPHKYMNTNACVRRIKCDICIYESNSFYLQAQEIRFDSKK